jgi:uncharacterized protein (DUF58 family)
VPSTSNLGDFRFKHLQQADLRRLEQVLFAPRKVIEGRYAGQYATRQRGQSIEFRDYRPYLPGDDPGAIDWKVFGRTNRLFIRIFEHQTELTVHLLVDASASMAYRGLLGSHGPPGAADSKFDYACRMAASIAFLIARQHDRFSIAYAQSRPGDRDASPLRHYAAPSSSLQRLSALLKTMESVQPAGVGRMAEALQELTRRGGRRDLVVLFSDLLDEPEELAAALAARTRHGGEAVVVQVLHPDELQLPDVELGLFVDSETGARVRLDVAEVRGQYQRRLQAHLDAWSQRCQALGVDYLRAEMSTSYFAILENYLLGRAAFRR